MYLRAQAVALLLLVFGFHGRILQAQRPERQHDVVIPGLGVRLREGWQMFFHDGCRYAVPATWRPIPDRSESFSPDGSTISLWTIRMMSNWSSQKARVKSGYSADARVREDTDSKLWIEWQENTRDQHLIVATDGTTACEAVLSIRRVNADVTDDAIAAIVGSVAAMSQWPAELR